MKKENQPSYESPQAQTVLLDIEEEVLLTSPRVDTGEDYKDRTDYDPTGTSSWTWNI